MNAWEYRLLRYQKKGWIALNTITVEETLNVLGEQGWELIQVSDSDRLAIFKRPAVGGTVAPEAELARHSLEREIVELGAAIEELHDR